MDRDSVTKDQAKTINASVQPSLAYLFRLRERMTKTGFLPGDHCSSWWIELTILFIGCSSNYFTFRAMASAGPPNKSLKLEQPGDST